MSPVTRTKQPAVLDASFWINLERMGLVAYRADYFDLVAPPRVALEATALLNQPDPPSATVLFAEWQRQ